MLRCFLLFFVYRKINCISLQLRSGFEREESEKRQFSGDGSQAMHNNASASSAFERNNFAIF